MPIKLSICIPTYNRAKYIEETLESIVKNKVASIPIEIVISDNNSSDATEEIVKEYQKQLSIKYSKNPKNIGASRNLMKAVTLAKGEFIWLFSDDDIMMKGSLEYLLKFLNKNKDVEYVYFPRKLVTKKLEPRECGIQPKGLRKNVIFKEGKDLFEFCDGKIAQILPFYSSTIIKRSTLLDSYQESDADLYNEMSYFAAILRAIRDKKCALLEKPGVLCRLENARPCNVPHSKIWFDGYIRCFFLALKRGYSARTCCKNIKIVIRIFSKSFVVDKAEGLRSDNILSCLNRIQKGCLKNVFTISFPWFFLSFFPTKILRVVKAIQKSLIQKANLFRKGLSRSNQNFL